MPKIKAVNINWDEQKKRLKKRFSSLTDRDLYFEKGQIEIMVKNLQIKLSLTRHEVYCIISRI